MGSCTRRADQVAAVGQNHRGHWKNNTSTVTAFNKECFPAISSVHPIHTLPVGKARNTFLLNQAAVNNPILFLKNLK
jgi:hypothetical protein